MRHFFSFHSSPPSFRMTHWKQSWQPEWKETSPFSTTGNAQTFETVPSQPRGERGPEDQALIVIRNRNTPPDNGGPQMFPRLGTFCAGRPRKKTSVTPQRRLERPVDSTGTPQCQKGKLFISVGEHEYVGCSSTEASCNPVNHVFCGVRDDACIVDLRLSNL